jgi:hypothetical protein
MSPGRDGTERRSLLECPERAGVAQLVEHFIRNEGVPGSSPGVGLVEAEQLFMNDLTPEQLQRRQQGAQIRQRFAEARTGSELLTAMSSSPPRRLHHYTTLDGLLGVTSSSEIWASDVRFVNDASELTYASDLIGSEVVAALKESKKIAGHLELHPDVANPLQVGIRPFIACFCEESDLLSQWRGYGVSKTAYALGFDLSGIISRIDPPVNTIVRKVVYDPEQQRGAVRLAMQIWIETAEALLDEEKMTPEDLFPYPAAWALQDALLEHYLCFKHPAFAEEKEWRLIKLVDVNEELALIDDRRMEQSFLAVKKQVEEADPTGRPFRVPSISRRRAEGVKICFRKSPVGLVPYIELPLKDAAGIFTGRLPLWEVVQGPSPYPDLSLESLRLFLRSKGYSQTEVEISQVPLRT